MSGSERHCHIFKHVIQCCYLGAFRTIFRGFSNFSGRKLAKNGSGSQTLPPHTGGFCNIPVSINNLILRTRTLENTRKKEKKNIKQEKTMGMGIQSFGLSAAFTLNSLLRKQAFRVAKIITYKTSPTSKSEDI